MNWYINLIDQTCMLYDVFSSAKPYKQSFYHHGDNLYWRSANICEFIREKHPFPTQLTQDWLFSSFF